MKISSHVFLLSARPEDLANINYFNTSIKKYDW